MIPVSVCERACLQTALFQGRSFSCPLLGREAGAIGCSAKNPRVHSVAHSISHNFICRGPYAISSCLKGPFLCCPVISSSLQPLVLSYAFLETSWVRIVVRVDCWCTLDAGGADCKHFCWRMNRIFPFFEKAPSRLSSV